MTKVAAPTSADIAVAIGREDKLYGMTPAEINDHDTNLWMGYIAGNKAWYHDRLQLLGNFSSLTEAQ